MLKRLNRHLSRRVKAGHFAPYDAKRQVEANMNNWRFDRGIISAYAPTQCMPKAPMPSSSGWTRVSGGTHRKRMNRKSKRMEKAGIISAEVAQSQMQKGAPSVCGKPRCHHHQVGLWFHPLCQHIRSMMSHRCSLTTITAESRTYILGLSEVIQCSQSGAVNGIPMAVPTQYVRG